MNRYGRLRDLAVLLPLGALLIFLPPYINIFDQPLLIFGIPLLPFAIFLFWLIGIVLTAVVARALNRADDETNQSADHPDASPPAADPSVPAPPER